MLGGFTIFVVALVVLLIVLLKAQNEIHKEEEGFSPPPSSNFNACGAPCSVLPPSWIGRLDQGNGLLGDDHLSGFNFYSAY